MAVGSQIAITNVLGNLVQDHMHTYILHLADFNLVVAQADHQTAKFKSYPNFLAIEYFTYFKIMNTITVNAMAISETVTPM